MDLNELVQSKMAALIENGALDAMLEKHLASCVEDVVKDTFGSWSPLNKELKAVVKEKLQIDLDKLKISGYNQVILNIVQKELDRAVTEIGVAQMKEQLDSLIGGIKPNVKLSELIEEMKTHERNKVDDDASKISLHVSDSAYLKFVYFDPEPYKDAYECRYHLAIDDKGHLTNVTIHGASFDNDLILGGLFGVDATLFRIFTMKGVIELDENDVELEYPEVYEVE